MTSYAVLQEAEAARELGRFGELMGCKLRKLKGKWYLVIDHKGQRKSKAVSASRSVAEEVRRQVEGRLALGDMGMFDSSSDSLTFAEYTEKWLRDYVAVELKRSTMRGYENVLKVYVLPVLGNKKLAHIKRNEIKTLLAKLGAQGLTKGTRHNVLAVISGVLSYAVDDELLEVNPALGLGRKSRKASKTKNTQFEAIALTHEEVDQFLQAAQEICSDYYPLFLVALRAGLRRGELVALQWGDLQFGRDDSDSNRFITVKHNYVRREATDPKSKKTRRVDMSKQLRQVLLKRREDHLLRAFQAGKTGIVDQLVFPSPDGKILDPDNLYHRYFQPLLDFSGLRRFRLHDLRHTFGSLLIQDGAPLKYVSQQMGHSSIQVTADCYGHLLPGADISWMDRLDTTPQTSANQTQTRSEFDVPESLQTIDFIGGGGRTRTYDLRIMRPSL
jgi:integrase